MIKWTFKQLGIGDYGLDFSELYNEHHEKLFEFQMDCWVEFEVIVLNLSKHYQPCYWFYQSCIQQKHKLITNTPQIFSFSYCDKIKIECWFKNIVDDQFWWPFCTVALYQ
jgi:hypothetical protein